MDNKGIEDAKAKLAEMNKVIGDLDESIRSAAFDLLVPLFFDDHERGSETKSETATKPGRERETASSHDPAQLFSKNEHDKPKDNVHLVAASLYAEYGLFPMTAADIRASADGAGLIIPTRPDNTMRSAKKAGRSLYRQKGSGWELTVSGEAFLKEKYGVTRGNRLRDPGSSE
jgi:hypothetical protein